MTSPSKSCILMGHGIDLVDVATFRGMLDLSDPQILMRYFTSSELHDAGDGAARIQKLAGRFAVKESVLKALGIGWGNGVSFADVEVAIDTSGAPQVVLHNRVRTLAAEHGISGWLVSISHTATAAMASVIAMG
jgi:holo-[acyl-carrier protein] synthase